MGYKTKFAFMLGTWFGSGKSKYAPGTAGSLAALPFAWVISAIFGPSTLLFAAIIVYGAGVWASNVMMQELNLHDPGMIVVDEVAGQWLTLCIAPLNIWAYLIGFGLFRLFDITKPFPASWADTQVKGGTGVMLDDIFAGLYGLIVLYVITRIFPGFFNGFI